MNPYLWKADYGNANWDIRHRLQLAFVYDVPFLKVTNPVLKAAFTKWQANGDISVQSGSPFNVVTGTDTANTSSSGTYRPNLVHAPSANCGRGHLIGCVDPTAFTLQNLYPIAPNGYAYGNAGRNLLYGPGAQVVNFSLFKNFPIHERMKFQFRFETFGFFNHTIFANPGGSLPGPGANTTTTFGTSSFGNITAAGGNRNIQLGAKLLF